MKDKNFDLKTISKTYENEIDPKKKKDFGIFYTDYSLAYNMINELNADKKAIIFDPCCGTGVFLNAAKDLGYKNVYGCDLDKNAINICKIKNDNVFVYDTIFNNYTDIIKKLNTNKEIDYIVGNPPYAVLNNNNCDNNLYEIYDSIKENGNNLFIGSIMQALSMLKQDGILSYIIPKNFLHVDVYSKFRKNILSKYNILEIIDLGTYFKNVRGEQIILTIQNRKTSNNKIIFKKLIYNSFELLSYIPQNFYTDEIMIFNSYQDYIVYKRLNKNRHILKEYTNVKIHRGHSKSTKAIKGRDIRKYGFKTKKLVDTGNQLFIQNIYSAESGSIATFGGNMEAGETITILSTDNKKRCKLFLALLHSSIWNLFLYKYCYNSSKLTMHTDAKYLYRIPMPDEEVLDKYMNTILDFVDKLEKENYMSDEWFSIYRELDNIIYLAYEINEHEALYINSEISKIQSKRWN